MSSVSTFESLSAKSLRTVHEELKLSDFLYKELSKCVTLHLALVKNKLGKADSVLEEAQMKNKALVDNIIAIKKENAKLNNKLRSQLGNKQLATQKLALIEKQNAELREKLAKEQRNIVDIDQAHANTCKQLEEKTRRVEELEQMCAEMKKRVAHCEAEETLYKRLAGEMKRIQEALLEGYKRAEQAQAELCEMKMTLEMNNRNILSKESELATVTRERDSQREDLNALINLKVAAVNKKQENINSLNEKHQQLENKHNKLEAVVRRLREDYAKLEIKYKKALDDKEMLRQRVMKLKLKSAGNANTKLCKYCSQEYLESENFNWSCRTHRVLFALFLHSTSTEGKCGGAAAKQAKKCPDANTPSTSVRRTKKIRRTRITKSTGRTQRRRT
eukprot:TRINITY_DN1427_c0_g4_i2.p1 TRINITY_DN1427_c0_g4~~TRINITY_DN1427_c0_g4_i2.p1  ORF type:complete len:390 (+),score=111.83 TRINITY_DN1427_c0_g4_i2:313-1482(+)